MVLSKAARSLFLPALVATLALTVFAAACGDDNGGDGNATPNPTQPAATEPAATQPAATEPAGATQPPDTTPSGIDENQPAVVAARADLLANVDLDPNALQVESVTAMTFSDSCLDVTAFTATPEVCAQVITPGYEIVFRVGGTSYTYRSNEAGTNVRFADVDVGG